MSTVTGYVRCTEGQWTQKSTGVCSLPGAITNTISEPNEFSGEHERLEGYQKQYQLWGSKCGVAGPTYRCANPYPGCGETEDECNEGSCLSDGCNVCLTGGNIPGSMGCRDYAAGYVVDCVKGLTYYEWECV